MAYAPGNPYQHPVWEDIKTTEYAIGGKLIAASVKVPDMHNHMYTPERIKQELAEQISRFMIENKLIEFTKLPSVRDMDITYYARCYVAPDSQVKILRSNAK